MKKFIFPILLVIQVLIIAIFAFQFHSVKTFGQKFIVHASTSSYSYTDDGYLKDTVYLEMPIINEIPADEWPYDTPFSNGKQVYALLKETADGSFQVEDVQKNRIKKTAKNEVVVQAIYSYYDEQEKVHYLEYFFSKVDHIEKYGDFKPSEEIALTIYHGRFGQYQITTIDPVNP